MSPQVEEVGVEAVVLGFPLFMAQIAAMGTAIAGTGTLGLGAAVGIGALSAALLGIGAIVVGAAVAIGGLVAGFAALAVSGFEIARSVESAFAGVAKTTPGLLDEFGLMTEAGERVRNEFRQLAFEIPLALEELLEIGQFAGQLGIAEEALAGFTSAAAALAVSTDLTAESATFALARIANIFNIQSENMVENAERLGSSVVFLGNNFATTESEILNFARRLAGTANVVGLTQANVVGIGGAFTAAGVEIQAGSTAVQRALITMSSAVAESGDDLDLFAETAGVSADQFARLWEDRPAEAFTMFVEGLGEAGEDAFQILDDLQLGNERTRRAFLAVAGTGDLLRDSLLGANQAFIDNTALARESEIRYQTFDSQLQMFKNSVRDVGLEIGDILMPFMKDLLDIATPIIEAIGDGLVPAFQSIVDSIETNLMPAISTLLDAFGFDISTADLTTSIANWGETAAEGIEAFSRFVEDVASAVETFREEGLTESLSEFFGVDEQTISNFFDVAKGLGAATLAFIGLKTAVLGAGAIAGVIGILAAVAGELGAALALVLGGESIIAVLGALALSLTTAIPGIFAVALAALIGVIAVFGKDALATLTTIWDGILIILGKFWDDMVELFNEQTLGEVFDRLVEVFGKVATILADRTIEWILDLGNTIGDAINKEMAQPVIEAWNIFWARVAEVTPVLLETIGLVIREKLEEWGIDVTAALKVIDVIMAGDWETIGNTISEAWDTMRARINVKLALIKLDLLIWALGILIDMRDKVGEWVQIGRDWIDGLLQGLRENAQLVIDFLLDLAQRALDEILDFWNATSPSGVMADLGADLMRGLAKGIADNAKLPQVALDMANAKVMNAGASALNGAGASTRDGTVDRSFNVGDINVNAQPQAPNRIVDDLATLALVQGA